MEADRQRMPAMIGFAANSEPNFMRLAASQDYDHGGTAWIRIVDQLSELSQGRDIPAVQVENQVPASSPACSAGVSG